MEQQETFANGIDVSHHRGLIDWGAVKASGVTYAILKSTESDNFIDSRFDYNWTQARQVGLIRGAYHFFRPLVDPVVQAQHFLRRVGDILHSTDLPPVLDVEIYPAFVQEEYERLTVSQRQQQVLLWLQTIEVATGKIPIIYTNYHTWAGFMGDSQGFTRYPLWVANYEVTKPRVPGNNWGGHGWTFWQYSSKGAVPGINNGTPSVDLNFYKDTHDALKAWLGIERPRLAPPVITNGDMMAAVVDAAESLGDQPDDWVRRLTLGYLIDPVVNVGRPYDGPAIAEMTMDDVDRQALILAIETRLKVTSSSWGINNQDMLNALYFAATQDGLAGWGLVEKAELTHLVDDREGIYTGPLIEELPELTDGQRIKIAEFLKVPYEGLSQTIDEPVEAPPPSPEPPSSEEPAEDTQPVEQESPGEAEYPTPYPYPDMTNQAMINSFYNAAYVLDLNGWGLIQKAEMEWLGEDRDAQYQGPPVEEMTGLTPAEKEVLAGNVAIMMEWQELEAEPPGEINDEQIEEPIEAVDPYPEITNQMMINAFYDAGEKLGEEGWNLIVKADLTVMTDDRMGLYTGPKVEEMAGLGVGEKITLGVVLGLEVNQLFGESPYPGMINQDMINQFYRAAAEFGQDGWAWVERAGLSYMSVNRIVRYQPYIGPPVAGMPGLNQDEKSALEFQLQALIVPV